MCPLSSEPITFGESRQVINYEKERQDTLFKKLKQENQHKDRVYRKELRKLASLVKWRFMEEHSSLNTPPSYMNKRFRGWLRRQPEYESLRKRMAERDIKIPGKPKNSVDI